MTFKPKATIKREAYDWASQVCQYSRRGTPGFTVERHYLKGDHPVDCLLWRDKDGFLRGILNYYPKDIPGDRFLQNGIAFRMGGERAGNANIWVDPNHRGKGIGTMVAREGMSRFGITIEAQRFTELGAALAEKLLREVAADLPESKVP